MIDLRQFRRYPWQSLLIVVAVALGVAVITSVAAVIRPNGRDTFSDTLYYREIKLTAKADDRGAFYQDNLPVYEIGAADDEPLVLTPGDLEAARQAVPEADYAYLTSWQSYDSVAANLYNLDVTAATPDYPLAARLELASGSLPSPSDYEQGRKVIVLTAEAVKGLGLEGDPVGQTLELNSYSGQTSFQVIGTLSSNEEAGWQSKNSLIPYQSVEVSNPRELLFAVDDLEDVDAARAGLEAFARSTWGERAVVRGANNGGVDAQQRLVATVIAAFASTALVAAALNIMNLMLARVLRASHDIGILRTLGATRRHILLRALGDALVLGALGGALGVGGGYALQRAYLLLLTQSYGENLPSEFLSFSPFAALTGLGVALSVSLLFGLYPAISAARVRTVDALKGAL